MPGNGGREWEWCKVRGDRVVQGKGGRVVPGKGDLVQGNGGREW